MPDHFAPDVQQRSTGVAGIDGRIGLKHVLLASRHAERPPERADHPDRLTLWPSLNGLPMAMTQSPGCIWSESAETSSR